MAPQHIPLKEGQMEMQNSNVQEQEFSLDMFNVSQESDDIQIILDENFEAAPSDIGRRC
jgi:hypothetical protein